MSAHLVVAVDQCPKSARVGLGGRSVMGCLYRLLRCRGQWCGAVGGLLRW